MEVQPGVCSSLFSYLCSHDLSAIRMTFSTSFRRSGWPAVWLTGTAIITTVIQKKIYSFPKVPTIADRLPAISTLGKPTAPDFVTQIHTTHSSDTLFSRVGNPFFLIATPHVGWLILTIPGFDKHDSGISSQAHGHIRFIWFLLIYYANIGMARYVDRHCKPFGCLSTLAGKPGKVSLQSRDTHSHKLRSADISFCQNNGYDAKI